MKHNKPLQLHIPAPCQEDWNNMTSEGQGRYCCSCQKSVIDFSTWSDRDIYHFFADNDKPVCGRFFKTQVYRDIQIPHQPKSKLYYLAIACGLTLMFTKIPDIQAQSRPPYNIINTDDGKSLAEGNTGSIEGYVYDDTGTPMTDVRVYAYQNNMRVAGAVTDENGKYALKQLKPGYYEITANHMSYTYTDQAVPVRSEKTTTHSLKLKPGALTPKQDVMIMGGTFSRH